MGWLYMKSLGGHAGPQAYLDDQFRYDAPSASYRVLQSALIGNRAYYAAVERTKSATNSRDVFAVVCLVDYNPSDPEGYIFGYKDMDETMGPYESTCPQPILDLLTPTDNAFATEWRERCRAAIRAKAAARIGNEPRDRGHGVR